MKKFINKFHGNIMYVDDNRVKEYKEAGHKLASDDDADEVVEESAEEEPVDIAGEAEQKANRKR